MTSSCSVFRILSQHVSVRSVLVWSLTVNVGEFTKGGLVKGGLPIDAFPLCNCNTSGSVFNVQIEDMPNC